MNTLRHLTLNTGHGRASPRAEVGPDVLSSLAHLTAPGTHRLPGPLGDDGYRLTSTPDGGALLATVYAPAGHPVVTIGVAPDADAADRLWPQLERLYLDLTDRLPGLRSADFAAPRRPESTPWVAVVIVKISPEEAAWVGDFERCLGWAWLERE